MLSTILALTLSGSSSPLQSVDARHQAWVSGGFASTWVVQLGGRVRLTEGLRLDVQLETPVVRPLVMGGRLAVGASFLHRFGDVFGSGFRVELGAPWANDFLGSWLGVDVRASVQPGVYRPRWALAADLSVIPTLAVSWTPSLVVRDAFGDRPLSAVQAPRSVGLLFPAFRFDLGVNGRVLVVGTTGPRLWLTGNASLVLTPARVTLTAPPTSTLPFTTTVGVLCEL